MAIRRYAIRGKRAPIPSITTDKVQTKPIDYKNGLFTGVPNDLQPNKTLRYIMDMRFNGVGKYRTRKGCDRYSVAIGEAANAQVTSTTGAADKSFGVTTWHAQKLTATTSGVATRVDVNIKNSAAATGTIMIGIYSNVSNQPGVLLGLSSITQSSMSTSYAYLSAYFIQAPIITNGSDYWVVVYLQESGTGNMSISSTTTSTNAKVSLDSGQTWASTAYSLNVKLYTATAGGVKGLTRVYRPDGTGITFFAHGTNVYKVDDVTGAATSIDSGISVSAPFVRFDYVNDVLYYVDGISKPRKYNFTTASSISASPYTTTNIMEHVGMLFYFDKADPTHLFFTNFADYETFTSTDFIYVPAPKKSDHLTAMGKLNGVLYPFTKKNKFMVMGQDRATFRLDEAYAQKGTFSQESLIFDENYIYFASDDGVYKFNGTSEKNIVEGILEDYTDLLYKEDIHLQLHNNRLYVWYRPNGDAEVNECIVYNTLYDVIESIDANTYVGRSFARHDTTDKFLQASNRAGVVYYGEQSTNDYHNLGSPLLAEVRTSYDHFGSPQQLKRIPYWRPIIQSSQGSYSLQAGFAADYSDDANFTDISLQGTGYTYDDPGTLYDSAVYAAGTAAIDTTLNIYGSAYRWQRRYKHHAAHEPIEFAGEVLKVQTRRLR